MRKISRKEFLRRSEPFTLGRASFEKISAVEGISYSADMIKTFRQLDKKGASPVERRQAIATKYGRSS
jgi:hypothetical protein